MAPALTMTDPGAGPPHRPDAPRPASPHGVLDDLRAAVAEHPENAELHRLLAVACAVRSRGDEALAEAGAALALEPNSADSHTVLGIALHEKDWVRAQRAYREALRLDPAQIDADLNLALAQARSGRLAEGIDRAARVVRREPASPWARWTLDRLLTRWCAEVYLTGAVIWLLCMLAVTQSPESLNPVKGPSSARR
ncbi:tetratricopeptide repeat protein [uncultured Actinomyces sp.]|uniref:tetratricopeptide repeat protein n=1 Tax=uncultured Actinomyces sp. TaxID=249061 RepID=UPI00288AB518|nr:tetratricopeptide repeat protein [uncultured Actinomyces sp.]